MMSDVSVVIPTLDADVEFGWEHKLRESAVDVELVVSDEGSASEARNAGIRRAGADKLVFLDDDSIPQGAYFERVSALLDEYPAVTGRIHDTGAAVTRGLSTNYDQGDTGHYTETVVGCNMAVRRSVLEDIGYFDERLPYGHEETELIDRLCAAYDVWYSPDLEVAHPYAESFLDYCEKQYRHGREGIRYYDIRGEDVHREMARIALVPSHYTGPTVRDTILRSAGQLVTIVGLLQGYVEYRLGDTRRDEGTHRDGDVGGNV